jgi:hypothetical protein
LESGGEITVRIGDRRDALAKGHVSGFQHPDRSGAQLVC